MPYNVEPIPPADEINGQTALPLARVKRIIKLDDDINACSNSAAFLVTVATEMFIQYLAKQGMKGAQRDRRKNLQYKDLANAVSVMDTLEFLSDTIPKTVQYKKVLQSKKASGTGGEEPEAGQLTIDGGRRTSSSKKKKNGSAKRNIADVEEGDEENGHSAQENDTIEVIDVDDEEMENGDSSPGGNQKNETGLLRNGTASEDEEDDEDEQMS